MLSQNEMLNIRTSFKLRCENYNRKRHQLLITLINTAMSLCGDKSSLLTLLLQYDLNPDDFHIDNDIELKTRDEIAAIFEQLIPEICENLYFKNIEIPCIKKASADNKQAFTVWNEEVPRYAFDEQCYKLISLLHEIILVDYANNNIADVLSVLINNKMSPIDPTLATPKYQTNYSHRDMEQITKCQRIIRSNLRKNLHYNLFSQNPNERASLPDNIKDNPRLIKIIHELTVAHAVINKIQYHWTTENNFRSIVRNGYFYGNKTLKKQGIFFRLNALGTGDIENGDNDIICFCPYMVDYLAFYSKTNRQLKSNVVRLSVNVQNIDLEGRYNQFFKLFDLWSPGFLYTVHITDELTFTLEREDRGKEVFITLILNGESCRINIFNGSNDSKNNVIHYGNLFSINRFCLLTLFNFLNSSDNKQFEQRVIDYLNAKDDNEIKKILIIIAQSLTVFSEYNFNSSLRLTDKMISEIHIANKSLTYNFSDLIPTDYQKALNDLTTKNYDALSFYAISESILSTHHTALEITINIYENTVSTERQFLTFQEQDFRQYPADFFSREIYFETRPQQNIATNMAASNEVMVLEL